MGNEKPKNTRLEDFKKRVEEMRAEYKSDKSSLIQKLNSAKKQTVSPKKFDLKSYKAEFTSEKNPFSMEEMIKRYKELKK